MEEMMHFIMEEQKFYTILPSYEVISETIDRNGNTMEVNGEVITNLSRYKFLDKILKKLVDKNLMHLKVHFRFDPELYQIKLRVEPKYKQHFQFDGILYCDPDFKILNHNITIAYSKSFEMVQKMFDTKIKHSILDQIERDIEYLKNYKKN